MDPFRGFFSSYLPRLPANDLQGIGSNEVNPNQPGERDAINFTILARDIARDRIQSFWKYRMMELNDDEVLRQRMFPLARIRKIMKQNPGTQMIGSATPLVLSKAMEFFLMEITIRAWMNAHSFGEEELKMVDIIAAFSMDNAYGFFLEKIMSRLSS